MRASTPPTCATSAVPACCCATVASSSRRSRRARHAGSPSPSTCCPTSRATTPRSRSRSPTSRCASSPPRSCASRSRPKTVDTHRRPRPAPCWSRTARHLMAAPDAKARADRHGHRRQRGLFPAEATSATSCASASATGRPGWIAVASTWSPARPAAARSCFDKSRMPPRLTVDYGHALVTRTRTLKLTRQGHRRRAHSRPLHLRGRRKVFYQANRGDTKSLEFATEVPLEPGINYVSVFARENQDVVTRETFVVRRDGEDGSLLETPEHDTDACDEFEADEDVSLEPTGAAAPRSVRSRQGRAGAPRNRRRLARRTPHRPVWPAGLLVTLQEITAGVASGIRRACAGPLRPGPPRGGDRTG